MQTQAEPRMQAQMLTLDSSKSDVRQALIRLTDDLPLDRLAQVFDYAIFLKMLSERGQQPERTPEQLQALQQLFAGPRHTGLYAALMRDRAEERARE